MSIEFQRLVAKNRQSKQVQSENRTERVRFVARDSVTGNYKVTTSSGGTIYGEKQYNTKSDPQKIIEYPQNQYTFEGKISNAVPRDRREIGYHQGQQFSFPKEEERKFNIKYVLKKIKNGKQTLWVCGFQSKCVKIVDLPVSAGISDDAVVINNLSNNNFFITFYYFLDGQYYFCFYNQDGLINQWIETGIKPFTGFPLLAAENPFFPVLENTTDPGVGNSFFYTMGYGLFIGNYIETQGTIKTPLTGYQPSTAYLSGLESIKIDLSKTPVKITRQVQPQASHSFYDSPGLGLSTNLWNGVTAWKSWNDTEVNNFSRIAYAGIDFDITGKAIVVYRLSRSKEKNIFQSISYTNQTRIQQQINITTGDNQLAIADTVVYSKPFNENFSNNRFINWFLTNLTGILPQFFDITENGINFIEYQQPGMFNNQPFPVPEKSLWRIERSVENKYVIVQLMNFELEKIGEISVKVFFPDINQGETTNYGEVLAASYRS